MLFALVANRAIDPSSKLAAAEWASHDVAIPAWRGMDDDQVYRVMDLLMEADTDAHVQEAVFFAVADLLNPEVDRIHANVGPSIFDAFPDGSFVLTRLVPVGRLPAALPGHPHDHPARFSSVQRYESVGALMMGAESDRGFFPF